MLFGYPDSVADVRRRYVQFLTGADTGAKLSNPRRVGVVCESPVGWLDSWDLGGVRQIQPAPPLRQRWTVEQGLPITCHAAVAQQRTKQSSAAAG